MLDSAELHDACRTNLGCFGGSEELESSSRGATPHQLWIGCGGNERGEVEPMVWLRICVPCDGFSSGAHTRNTRLTMVDETFDRHIKSLGPSAIRTRVCMYCTYI